MTATPDIEAALDFAVSNVLHEVRREIGDAATAVELVDRHPDRQLVVVDLEERLGAPRRCRGTATFDQADSLVCWVGDQQDETNVRDLYADHATLGVTVILNPCRPGVPSWEDERGHLKLGWHPSWARWRQLDGAIIDQSTFAHHVQVAAADIASPPALDMLEVAETLTLNVGAKVSSAVRQRDGQRHLIFDETVEASAGVEREVTIPETFTLRVPIFVGETPVEVVCRLLYRKIEGTVRFIVQIVDRDQVERDAFEAVALRVAEQLETHAMFGRPAERRPAPTSTVLR